MNWASLRRVVDPEAPHENGAVTLMTLPRPLHRRLKCAGPAAVGVDDFVNLLHQANGLREADNYLLVVRDVLLGERLEVSIR
jgi:hypothetical protein